jgi:predicted nucleotidyltransferase
MIHRTEPTWFGGARPALPRVLCALAVIALLHGCGADVEPGGQSSDDLVAVSRPVSEPRPWFVDEAQVRGLDFVHQSGVRDGMLLLPEIVGGGAALADFDNDGDLDIYLVQSGNGLRSGGALADQVFVNDGRGSFSAAAAAGHTGYGMGVAAGDYDNDGDVDLYVTNVGANALLQNDGTGHFTDVAAAAGVADEGWGTAAAFADFDADGDLDLFVVNYMNWSLRIERECRSRGVSTYCSPNTYQAPAMDRLYRNDGNASFSDVTSDSGINLAFGNGLGIAVRDIDGDGATDVFVANDKTVNQLWLNRGQLRFVDEAAFWGCAVDEHGTAKAGMGVATGDTDRDGDVDLLVVNLEGETDSYYRNDGTYFTDATVSVGLARRSAKHTRFGVVLADFDNDGWLDLYEGNGKVDGNAMAPVDAFAEPNSLYQGVPQTGQDGSGSKVLAGIRFVPVVPSGGVTAAALQTTRGVAFGDVDDDGGIDLLVMNRDAAPALLMNRAARGNWLKLRVVNRDGRDAIGARVRVRVGARIFVDEVQPAASYLAANDPRIHVGLGAATGVDEISVHWVGGDAEMFKPPPINQVVVLAEGGGRPDER